MGRWLGAVGCLVLCFAASAHAELSERELRVLARAEQERAAGRPTRTLALLARVIARNPEEPEPWLRYGALSTPCTADRLLAPKRAPRSQAQRVWLGLPERHALDQAELEVAWRRVLGHWAVHLAISREWPRALEVAHRASTRGDREAVMCLRQVAAQAVDQERLREAEGALVLARALVPEDPVLPRELALVLLARGDARGAVEQLSEALAADPNVLETREDLAYALSAAGRAEEGHRLLAGERSRCIAVEASSREPNSAVPTCWLLLARLALESRELQEAERETSELLSRAPRTLDGWLLLGEIRVQAGDATGATRAYEEALRLAPGHARARAALNALEGKAPTDR